MLYRLYKRAPPLCPEYCKVTFTFDSTHEDELSLKEGDVIHVLSKVRRSKVNRRSKVKLMTTNQTTWSHSKHRSHS